MTKDVEVLEEHRYKLDEPSYAEVAIKIGGTTYRGSLEIKKNEEVKIKPFLNKNPSLYKVAVVTEDAELWQVIQGKTNITSVLNRLANILLSEEEMKSVKYWLVLSEIEVEK